MSPFGIYALIALLLLVASLPVIVQETRRAFDPSETRRDQVVAVFVILGIVVLCLFWLAAFAIWICTLLSDKQKERLRKSDELRREGY